MVELLGHPIGFAEDSREDRSPNIRLARSAQSRRAMFFVLDRAFRFIEGNDRQKSKGKGKYLSSPWVGEAGGRLLQNINDQSGSFYRT
jgi:hypothetical protein